MELTRAQRLLVLAGLVAVLMSLALLSLGRTQARARTSRNATYNAPFVKPPSPLTITVHVIGEVHWPGVYVLAFGSRMGDLVQTSGGLTDKADIDNVNLALVLHDGQQVRVPRRHVSQTADSLQQASSVPPAPPSDEIPPAEPAGEAKPTNTPAPEAGGKGEPQIVSLNEASQAQLDALPGLGPQMSKRIIEYRSEHGGFRSLDELREVKGIGEARLEALRPYLRL